MDKEVKRIFCLYGSLIILFVNFYQVRLLIYWLAHFSLGVWLLKFMYILSINLLSDESLSMAHPIAPFSVQKLLHPMWFHSLFLTSILSHWSPIHKVGACVSTLKWAFVCLFVLFTNFQIESFKLSVTTLKSWINFELILHRVNIVI